MTTTTTPRSLELWNADPADLDALIEGAARDLFRNQLDGYRDGYEEDLKNYVVGSYTAAAIEADSPKFHAQLVETGLKRLARERMAKLVTVEQLLDEDEEASFLVAGGMADLLLEAVRAQDRELATLEQLIEQEIVDRSLYSHIRDAVRKAKAQELIDEMVAEGKLVRLVGGSAHRSRKAQWLALPGSPCSGCATPQKRVRDGEHGSLEICINPDCDRDK